MSKTASSPSPSTHVSDEEKGARVSVVQEENRETPLYNPDVDISGVDERKLMRKIDLRLVPWLALLYLLSFLDRTSIGNAKLYGMEKDLHITDTQYLIGTLQRLPQASATLVMALRPHAIMGHYDGAQSLRACTLHALIQAQTVQGLVHNYGGLLGMRWMLGMMEAGLFPGVNYYLSCWYKRSEFGLRAAIFFSAASVSGAFGGLLAAAISNMEGVGGKAGWSWIFILEGLATILAGIISFWIIQDFPDTAKFLSEAERTVVVRRLQSDDQFSAAGENLRWKYIWKSVFDWKTWIGMVVYVGSDMPLYAFSLFLPSIISQLGFKATAANLLTVPVYAFACIMTCLVGWFADRKGQRGLLNILFLCLGGAGYIILIASRSAALSYFAVFLATCGIYPLIPNTIAWVSNNVEGSYKRSVTLAMVISFGNINGAVSSNVYRARDAPWYPLGHGLVLMYIGFGLIASTSFYIYLKRENTAKERGERDEVIDGDDVDSKEDPEVREARARKNGRFTSVAEAKREKGDEWSGYRYTL
ncbi:hypothetical protein EVG20_g3195 [Dentipellis fragilis]|uniref:Major facilitator superfamily (MFS) profile domain-containing protein n=1 Tax=Dentipellis fragilis TaxID=205917 RepID=A0A4Y9Z435_9AGAM|nr:hypothetical protein EVG20_g3195 [Dentipellis fragilis]